MKTYLRINYNKLKVGSFYIVIAFHILNKTVLHLLDNEIWEATSFLNILHIEGRSHKRMCIIWIIAFLFFASYIRGYLEMLFTLPQSKLQ